MSDTPFDPTLYGPGTTPGSPFHPDATPPAQAQPSEAHLQTVDAIFTALSSYGGIGRDGMARLICASEARATEKLTSVVADRTREAVAAMERADKAERRERRMRENCRIIFYPPKNGYPIEHAPHARKDQWDAIQSALAI